MKPKQTAGKHWRQPKGFQVSFTQPKIGSQSWRHRSDFIAKRLNAPKVGLARFPLRLRIVLLTGLKKSNGFNDLVHTVKFSLMSDAGFTLMGSALLRHVLITSHNRSRKHPSALA